MTYQQTQPHQALIAHIDAFWTVNNSEKKSVSEKILPDGCVDIILNLGEDCKTDNGAFNISSGKAYLVGTMQQFKMTEIIPGTQLLGIRFKPAAFPAFFKFTSLHEVTDITVEFDLEFSRDMKKLTSYPIEYLNRFFLDKLTDMRHDLLPVITDIQNHHGKISVADLARRHCTTERQLERGFRQHVGLSPKEFIKLVRYQSVLPVIKNRSAEKSLSEIAFEYGYYDHAHLTSEIKRYTGVAPTGL